MTRTSLPTIAAVLLAALLLGDGPGGQVPWLTATAQARSLTDVHRVTVDSGGMVRMKDVVAVLNRYIDRTSGPVVAHPDAREKVTGPVGKHVVRRWNMTFKTVGVSFEATGPFLVITVQAHKPSLAKRYYRRMVKRLGGTAEAPKRKAKPADQPIVTPAKLGITRFPDSRPAGPPVVLIHGMDSSPQTLSAATSGLSDKGYDVYVFHYSSESRISDSALFLGRELRTLRKSVKRRISLVTLSLGGVIALYAIERDPQYRDDVDRFIACAPPFRGAGLAKYRPLSTLKDAVSGLAAQGLGKVLVFQGLGDAATDLEPGSRLLQLLKKGKRKPRVKYSILAGNQPIIPAPLLAAISGVAQQLRQKGGNNELVGWLSGITEEATRVSGGKGDGVVLLSSTKLKGVRDRQVLPINHMQFLATPRRGGPVPALAEVLERLPKTR